jgi:site-specific recombinase XerD
VKFTEPQPKAAAKIKNPALCLDPGCEAPSHHRGLCGKHYQYYRKYDLFDQLPRIEAVARSYEAPTGKGPTGPKLWGRYLEHLQALNRRPATILLYRKTLYGFWDHCGKMLEPRLVTKKDLQDYLSRTTNSQRSRGRRLSAVSANNQGHIIMGAYRWFAQNGLIGSKDPLVGYTLPKVTLGPPRALDPEDVARLFEAAEATDDRLATMLWLAYGAGLRVSEIAAVRMEHIQPARGNRPMTIEVFGKGGYRAVVPIQNEAADWIKRYMAGRPRIGPLIANRNFPDRHIDGHLVSRIISRFMRSQGIAESAHSLRHTFATELMIASEGNLRAVQRLVRHKSSATTERYTSAWDGEMFAVSKLLPSPRRVG